MESNIPVIDVGKICEEGELKKLRDACERWGCFRIINHSIPLTLMAEMKKVIEALHDVPVEIKKRHTEAISSGGYSGPTPLSPFYEALGIYDMASSNSMRNFCSHLDVSSHHRQIMEAYGQAIHGLAVSIGQKMAESLNVESADFEDWKWEFKFNKYNFTPETVGLTGLRIHTDSGFLTIIQDDENVSGLEVMATSGSLVPISPLQGAFLVNLGDVAHAWSNGRFCSLRHRVQCKEGTQRFSIVTLMLGPRNGNVEAPTELVDHDHPRLYQPFIYEDYRKLRISKKMPTSEALELLYAWPKGYIGTKI